jgi:hypothetical protein
MSALEAERLATRQRYRDAYPPRSDHPAVMARDWA